MTRPAAGGAELAGFSPAVRRLIPGQTMPTGLAVCLDCAWHSITQTARRESYDHAEQHGHVTMYH